MKKLTINLMIILFTISGLMNNVSAQAPEGIIYQAEARDSRGKILSNTDLNIKISIIQGGYSGPVVYEELHNVRTSINGMFVLVIGHGTVQSGFLENVEWGNYSHFLNVQVKEAKKIEWTDMGTTQLLSVPYALHSKTAETFTGTIIEADPLFTAWDKSAGISITESQISDLGAYIESESDPAVAANFDFTDAANGDLLQFNGTKWVKVTPDYISDYTVTEEDVTAHQGALEITESQITDLKAYATKNMGNEKITNLADPTDAQDAATKAYVDVLLARIEALEGPDLLKNGFIDQRDGNHYKVVQIGDQIWMAENLNYTPVSGNSWCYDDNTDNCETYGRLYDWDTVMNGASSSTANPSGVQGVCPSGWHVPSDAEWTELTNYLGGESVAGGKLKETGTTHWISPNVGATNETGFTALPSGARIHDGGTFEAIGYDLFLWSATESNCCFAMRRIVSYQSRNVYRFDEPKMLGYSVRCLQD